MTELIYHVATTADHYIAGPNGEADESIFRHYDDVIADFLESVSTYDAVLMGRNTYEFGFQFGMEPGKPSGIALAAKPELKHYIFSKSMEDFPKSTVETESNQTTGHSGSSHPVNDDTVELIREDAVAFVRNLKRAGDHKTIWICGGGQLAGSLLEAELIDRLILKVNPVIIGSGIPLFGGSRKKIRLNLLDLKRYDSGVILLGYRILYE